MFQRWPKRDPNKHYYLVPNEVFNLGLSSHEIAVYNYLLRCEDRRTYQCHPSYRTIGKAVQLSENTVRKYVAGLEEKGLIRTEPSTITTKDGRVRNGSLMRAETEVEHLVWHEVVILVRISLRPTPEHQASPPVCASTHRRNSSLGTTMRLPIRSAGKPVSCMSS